jgi:hypothetical protein
MPILYRLLLDARKTSCVSVKGIGGIPIRYRNEPDTQALVYEAEISSSTVTAGLETIGASPEAAPISPQVSVVAKLAKRLSETLDRLSDELRGAAH